MTDNTVWLEATVRLRFPENASTYDDRTPAAIAAIHNEDATFDPAHYWSLWIAPHDTEVVSVSVAPAGDTR